MRKSGDTGKLCSSHLPCLEMKKTTLLIKMYVWKVDFCGTLWRYHLHASCRMISVRTQPWTRVLLVSSTTIISAGTSAYSENHVSRKTAFFPPRPEGRGFPKASRYLVALFSTAPGCCLCCYVAAFRTKNFHYHLLTAYSAEQYIAQQFTVSSVKPGSGS